MEIDQSKKHVSIESSKDRERREILSPVAQTPCTSMGPVWDECQGTLVSQAPSALCRHQVLRVSVADEAQVQKVKELEDLEHLQVRARVRASVKSQETSWAGWGRLPSPAVSSWALAQPLNREP